MDKEIIKIANKIKIDYLYYLEHQIMSPVCQILDILVEHSKNLFSGIIKQEHKNRVSKIREYNNNKKGQKDLSQFFSFNKQEEESITIEIPENVGLKKKIEKKIEEQKEHNLDSYFKQK